MKKNIIIYLASLLLILLLTNCKEEALETQLSFEDKGYIVENGYIKFNNINSYDSVIKNLTTLNRTQLLQFKESLNFTTLYDTYHKVGLPVDSLNGQVEDVYLTILLNKDGMLMVGDTILKIKDNIAYLIEGANFETLKKINNGIDVSSEKNVKLTRHSNQLTIVNSNSEIKRLRGTSTEYDGFVQTGIFNKGTTIQREEKVKLGAFCVISPFWPFGLTYIGAKMNGEARTKNGLFGGWCSWFNDEIFSGSITINSGKFGPSGNCVWDVVPGVFSYIIPDTEFKTGREYGHTNDLHAENLSVTYKYIKTEGFSLHTKTIVWE